MKQRATFYRPDLAGAERDGFHGFSMMLPGSQRESLVIEDAGSGFTVPLGK